MPWCAALRDRPLADGDERGLPGQRGPRADGPVPARRPAGRGAARLDDDALDADLERRRGGRRGAALRQGPPGRRPVLARQGHAQDRRSQGPFEVEEERPDATSSAGATRGRSTTCRRSRDAVRRRPRYEHRVVAWDEVGEDEGTGIVHIAPGCGAEDFQLGKALGLPVIAPLDESGIVLDGFGSLSRPRRARRRRADRRAPQATPTASTASSRTPTATRTAGAAGRRSSSASSTSGTSAMGPVYDQPRETLTHGAGRREPALPDHGRRRPDPLDPRLRLRARARLAPQHARLDDQQEALLGPGAADLRLRGVRHGRRRRRARRAARARGRGLGRVRGPHAAPAVGRRGPIACPSCGAARSSASRTSATRGWTPASCRSRRSTTARTPTTGRSGSRPTSSPRASPASSATGSTRCSRCRRSSPRGAVQDDLRLRPRLRRGRPADAQELGQRDRLRRGGRADGRRRHALDVRQGAARGEHPLRLARRRRGAPRAAHPLERLRVLRDLRPARRLDARPTVGAAASPSDPPLDRWILSRAAGTRRGRRGPPCATSTRSGRPARSSTFIDGLSTWYLRLSRRRFSRSDDAADRAAAFATLHEALVATSPDARADPAVPGRRDVRQPRHDGRRRRARQRPPHPLADRRARRRFATRGSRRRWTIAQRAVDLARTLRGQAGIKTRQPLARAWLALSRRCDAAALRRRVCSTSSPEINVKAVELIADGSELVERRVKPLLPKIGKRLGSAIPAVMAAARDGDVDVPRRWLGDARRRDAGRRRGRDPGDAATGHGRRRGRWPRDGPRHRVDRRSCEPKATRASSRGPSRTSGATPGSSSTTGSSCGSTGCRTSVAAYLPAVAADTLADLRDGRPAGRRPGRPLRSTPGRSRSPCGGLA